MIIAQISDSHLDPESPNAAARMHDLERCVADINRLDPQPDAVIHTGDITHNGTPEKYDVALRLLEQLRPPLHVAAGNRDDRALIAANFTTGRDLMPDTPFIQYSIDSYPVRLIALDTLSETSNLGDFCDVRARNLSQALAKDTSKPTVLFMHHPPFEITKSKFRFQFDDWDGVGRMAEAMEGHSQVMRVFTGHAHRDASGIIAGVPAQSVPSIAIDLRFEMYSGAAKAAPVYFIHRFDGQFVTETRIADQI